MSLRLATYNVEWFNALFDDRGHLLENRGRSARYGVTRADQLAAIGIVFSALDADGVLVVEAPDQGSTRSTTRALENFARAYGLRQRRAVTGFASDSEQEIAFLFDPDRLQVQHDPQGIVTGAQGGHGDARFDQTFRYDLDADGLSDLIRLSKPPLELLVTPRGGAPLRLIGVHAKSKTPHGVADKAAFSRISIDNRRKQLAECLWIRARAVQHLAAGESLVVMGDFNDGPGLDEYEKLFGRSGVEIVLGDAADPALHLKEPHAEQALARRPGLAPTTARFWLAPERRFYEALVDFIMVSPDLALKRPLWRIWHPFNDPGAASVPELAQAILTASDHFPVTIDL